MTQTRSYKQYQKKFKEEAVVLVLEQAYAVPKATKSLVQPSICYTARKLHEQRVHGKVLVEDEREKLKYETNYL